MRERALLEVRDLHAWYGESHILHGVDFEVRQGEVVTLLGRNGAGKTTTLKSVMGMVSRRRGSIRFGGQQLIMLPSNRIARLGLAFCPEERGIFASLNVEENLLLPPEVRPGGLSERDVFGLFPNLITSTIDPAYDLTIYSSASAENTLQVALIIALIGMPFVLLYTAGVYYFFRGKVVVEPKSY